MAALQRILYIEDDADIQAVAKLALEMVGGFTVNAYASGAAALREAEAFAPDVILLDVMMPGLDGPATLQALRALPTLATVPAIFMTAKVQPTEVAYYKSLGAQGVITKPFDPMMLADQVRSIGEKRDE